MKPLITTLSYSAGEQSHAILCMVLDGTIPRPENFYVINADPGMEDSRSYAFVKVAAERCKLAGIPFVTAPGPNLYKGLISLPDSGATRFDHPPYWVKKPNGKRGKLKQKCTRHFKIAPMRRAIRDILTRDFGISRVARRGLPQVETWIGFGFDEASRIKLRKWVKYVDLKYPLVERQITRAMVSGYYLRTGEPKPPRSVCVACFANGLAHFEDMYLNRPDEWDQAVKVDESIRDLTPIGVNMPAFVSATLTPLRELPDLDFLRGTPEGKEHRCNSGVCFV